MERLLLLLALAAAVGVAVAGVRGWARVRGRQLAASAPEHLWRALGAEPDGRPAVVAFSTSACSECRVQARVLAPLAREGVRLLSIDAAAQAGAARAFGVLTVPSTAVLAEDGRVLAVNHGLAGQDRLRGQLAPVSVHREGAPTSSMPTG
jgi:thioredoxin-like negative regulator of GroEL